MQYFPFFLELWLLFKGQEIVFFIVFSLKRNLFYGTFKFLETTLKCGILILRANSLFGDLLFTLSTKTLLYARNCTRSWLICIHILLVNNTVTLWLMFHCVWSLRWGDCSLLGPGPASFVLRQLWSLCNHVGHR